MKAVRCGAEHHKAVQTGAKQCNAARCSAMHGHELRLRRGAMRCRHVLRRACVHFLCAGMWSSVILRIRGTLHFWTSLSTCVPCLGVRTRRSAHKHTFQPATRVHAHRSAWRLAPFVAFHQRTRGVSPALLSNTLWTSTRAACPWG